MSESPPSPSAGPQSRATSGWGWRALGDRLGPPDSWARLLLVAVALFLALRGTLLVCDFLGVSLTPNMGKCRKQWNVFDREHYFLNGFFRWDGGWYRGIVLRGYRYHEGKPSSIAFYPLYPYLARGLGKLVGSPWVAGLVISNVASALGVFYLLRLSRQWFDDRVGRDAAVLLLLFPTSFFLSAFYTEGLFFGLSAATMYYFANGSYRRAGALAFLCSLTRSFGLPLWISLGVHLAWQVLHKRERPRAVWLWLLGGPLGLASFIGYQWLAFDEPLAFIKTQMSWDSHRDWPWVILVETLQHLDWSFPDDSRNTEHFLNLACVAGFAVLTVYMARRRFPIALWCFVGLGLLMPLSAHTINGIKRYCVSLWPAFFGLAVWVDGKPLAKQALTVAFTVLLTVYSLRFMQCGWAG